MRRGFLRSSGATQVVSTAFLLPWSDPAWGTCCCVWAVHDPLALEENRGRTWREGLGGGKVGFNSDDPLCEPNTVTFCGRLACCAALQRSSCDAGWDHMDDATEETFVDEVELKDELDDVYDEVYDEVVDA